MKDQIIEQMLLRINQHEGRLSALERLENAMAQNHGWISAAWQNDPLRLGYSGIINLLATNESLSAGANALYDAAVPAGEIWVITNAVIRYDGTVAGVSIAFTKYDGVADTMDLFSIFPPVSATYYDRQGYWVFAPTEIPQMYITGATLNDNAYFRAVGWRIDIDQ